MYVCNCEDFLFVLESGFSRSWTGLILFQFDFVVDLGGICESNFTGARLRWVVL